MIRYIRLFLIFCAFTYSTVSCEEEESGKGLGTPTVALATSVLKTMENVTPLQIPVTMNVPATRDVKVTVAVKSEEGAKENVHYRFQNKEIVIVKGASIGYFFVDMTDDREINPDRVFTIEIVQAQGAAVAGKGTECQIVIQSDEGYPQIGFRSTQVTAAEETSQLLLGITLSKPYREGVNFTVAIKEGGTAVEGEHFTITTKEYTIAAGDTATNFVVNIIDDYVVNDDRTFELRITASTNSQITEIYQECKVKIVNDDRDAHASFIRKSAEVYEVDEFVWVPVKVSGLYKHPVKVTLRAEDGTAKNGTDYEMPEQVLMFENGKTQDSVKVLIIDNDVINNNKAFRVFVSEVEGGLRAEKDSIMDITILNDDINLKNVYDNMIGKWTITTIDMPKGCAMIISGGDTPAEEDANYQKILICRAVKFAEGKNGEMQVITGEEVCWNLGFGGDWGWCNIRFYPGGIANNPGMEATPVSMTTNKSFTQLYWNPSVAVYGMLYSVATGERFDVYYIKLQNVVMTKNK